MVPGSFAAFDIHRCSAFRNFGTGVGESRPGMFIENYIIMGAI